MSIKTVNKIVADSSDADQAIARLKAARVTKQVAVIESGGKAALALAEKLNGKRRLTDAQKRIITRGGRGAREISPSTGDESPTSASPSARTRQHQLGPG